MHPQLTHVLKDVQSNKFAIGIYNILESIFNSREKTWSPVNV